MNQKLRIDKGDVIEILKDSEGEEDFLETYGDPRVEVGRKGTGRDETRWL